jgi:hypothetical protein
VLWPGAVLWASCVAVSHELGRSWRARRRAVGRGTGPGYGEDDAWGVIQAGGGAAATAEWQPGEALRRW